MRTIVIIIFLFFICSEALSQLCTPPYWSYRPILNQPIPSPKETITAGWIPYPSFWDDFGAKYLNKSKWEVWNSVCHVMSPYAYFKDDTLNVYLGQGMLHIKTLHDSVDSVYCCPGSPAPCDYYHYSSGVVNTINYLRYGYVAVGCWLPAEMKLNPSVWIEGSHRDTLGIIDEKDEMDLFEDIPGNLYDDHRFRQNFGHNMFMNGTIGTTQIIEFDQPFTNQFIEFAFEWLPNEIRYLINGQITLSMKYTTHEEWISLMSPRFSEFTCIDMLNALPQRIILSLSLVNDTVPDISDDFKIEYVHTYKLQEGCNCEYWPYNFNLSNPDMFKVHRAVKLGGDSTHTAIVHPGNDVTIWGIDYILLDKGFTVQPGSEFTARTIQIDQAKELFKISPPGNEEEDR